MRFASFHSGHDMNISLFEDGKLLYHLELERYYNIKRYGDFQGEGYGVKQHANLLPTFFDHVLPSKGWDLGSVDAICLDTIQWFMTLYPDEELQRTLYRLHYSTNPGRSFDVGRRDYRGRDRDFCAVMHHLSHEAYAYYTGPFEDALILVYDGLGEFDINTSWAVGDHSQLRHMGDFTHHRPEGVEQNSIGFLYMLLGSVFTFMYANTHDAPGKAMGLSSYGTPVDRWRPFIRELIRGYVRQPHDLIGIREVLGLTREELHDSQSNAARDLMATVQDEAELYMIETVAKLVRLTGKRNLCLAGGCALNVKINSRLLDEGVIDALYVPPACSDTGNGIGNGLVYWHMHLGHPFHPRPYHTPYLGDTVANAETCDTTGLQVRECGDEVELCRRVSALLADGKIIGWAQGRSEIGPRALGNRSILASPVDPGMKDRINLEIKHRDYWRPFAPVCLLDRAPEWFETDLGHPYMLQSPRVRPEKAGMIPAVTHVDGTARLQTVARDQNPLLHLLLRSFEARISVPVLLNTSLNNRGCPIANDADVILKLLRETGLHAAVIGMRIYTK